MSNVNYFCGTPVGHVITPWSPTLLCLHIFFQHRSRHMTIENTIMLIKAIQAPIILNTKPSDLKQVQLKVIQNIEQTVTFKYLHFFHFLLLLFMNDSGGWLFLKNIIARFFIHLIFRVNFTYLTTYRASLHELCRFPPQYWTQNEKKLTFNFSVI